MSFERFDQEPDPREVLKVVFALHALKAARHLKGEVDWVRGKEISPDHGKIASLRSETLGVGDTLVSTQELIRRVDRAKELTNTTPAKEVPEGIRKRAVYQLNLIREGVDQADPDSNKEEFSFSFNDLNEIFACAILAEDAGVAEDLDAQLAHQNAVLEAARLAADSYALASME